MVTERRNMERETCLDGKENRLGKPARATVWSLMVESDCSLGSSPRVSCQDIRLSLEMEQLEMFTVESWSRESSGTPCNQLGLVHKTPVVSPPRSGVARVGLTAGTSL